MTVHVLGSLVLAWFALQASWEALTYLAGGPPGFDVLFREKYTLHLPLVVLHGVSGSLALCAGLPQFLRTWRGHRTVGRVYLAAVVTAALTGLPMAWMAFGGPVAQAGFLVFDVLWLVTAWLGWSTVRSRQFAAHRRWMLRNYALTYGAVMVRLLLNGLQVNGYSFEASYPASSWIAWGTALGFTELCLVRGGRPWA